MDLRTDFPCFRVIKKTCALAGYMFSAFSSSYRFAQSGRSHQFEIANYQQELHSHTNLIFYKQKSLLNARRKFLKSGFEAL